jgi:hypothetical protein
MINISIAFLGRIDMINFTGNASGKGRPMAGTEPTHTSSETLKCKGRYSGGPTRKLREVSRYFPESADIIYGILDEHRSDKCSINIFSWSDIKYGCN